MIIKNTDKKDSDKVLKEIPYLSEKAFLKLWAYLKWLKLNVIKMNEWLWLWQRQNKIKIIGYQFVMISEFCVNSRSRSSDDEDILTGLGCTHVQCTVSGWRTSRKWSPGCGQNGAGTMRGEINLRSNMKFQSSPSIGKFFRHLWRTGYSGKSYLFRKCDFSRKCDFFKHFTQYQTFGSVFGFWV